MKQYQFKTFDEILINYLERQESKSEVIRNILTKYVQGDLVSKSDPDVEFKLLRNEKYRKQILDLDIRNKVRLIHELKFTPEKAQRIADGKEILVTVTTDGSTGEPTYIPPEELNINKYLDYLKNENNVWNCHCKYCDKIFQDPNRNDSLKEYKDHLYDQHLKELTK